MLDQRDPGPGPGPVLTLPNNVIFSTSTEFWSVSSTSGKVKHQRLNRQRVFKRTRWYQHRYAGSEVLVGNVDCATNRRWKISCQHAATVLSHLANDTLPWQHTCQHQQQPIHSSKVFVFIFIRLKSRTWILWSIHRSITQDMHKIHT